MKERGLTADQQQTSIFLIAAACQNAMKNLRSKNSKIFKEKNGGANTF